MSNPKGQAAIEYLMNYAWAIALIIIVGIAIFGLNIGGVRNSLTGQSSQLVQAGEQVSVAGFTCDTTEKTVVSFQNNGATLIKNLYVNITPNTSVSIAEATKIKYTFTTCNSTTSVNVFPGQTTTCESLPSNKTRCANSAGQPYSLQITFSYLDDGSGLTYKPARNFTGTLQTG